MSIGAGFCCPQAFGSSSMDLKALGQNIRKCRKEQGLSQEQLAEKTGLSANYIGLIERGEKQPALDTLVNILNTLNASADLVLSGDLNYVKIKKKNVIEREFKDAMREHISIAYTLIEELEKHQNK